MPQTASRLRRAESRFERESYPDLDAFDLGGPIEGFSFAPIKQEDRAPSVKQRSFEFPPEWFHKGQLEAWAQKAADFVLVLAGSQGGKTTFGPHWLIREIQRCGPGDYLIAGPSITLLRKRVLPEFRKVFCTQFLLGKEVRSPEHMFVLSEIGEQILFGRLQETPTVIYIGRGDEPESLESMTLKGAWLDECGQPRFKQGSFDAIRRRFGATGGRILMTTTPYDLGWLKSEVYDPWEAGDTDYAVIRFESRMNPAYDMKVWYRELKKLPKWKFDLFYRAIFTRPAGAIFDTFVREVNACKRFRIPDHWQRFVGTDFGPDNTAAVKVAIDPDTLGDEDGPTMYVYRTYHKGGVSTAEHVKAILKLEPGREDVEPWIPDAAGGMTSEDGWRNDFTLNGLPISKPTVKGVEDGIQAVYGLIKTCKLIVFDDLEKMLEELEKYSRELDPEGRPIPGKIANKSKFHRTDALRYGVSEWVHNPSFARTREIRSVAVGQRGNEQYGGYY